MSLIRKHFRLAMALCLGAALAGLALQFGLDGVTVALCGINGFFVGYLGLTLRLISQITPDDLRDRAEEDDEGAVLILLLAAGAVVVSLGAIFHLLASDTRQMLTVGLSMAAVPLGWAMVHTLAAFRYARLFYADKLGVGLRFPETPEPGPWDFIYHAFAVGTSAAVSDVATESTRMRQLVLMHATGSFFYNTVIVALAVNAGIVLGQSGS